jgi:PKD repeat protein
MHVYTTPGSFTVTLEVSNGFGQDTRVRTNFVSVTTAPMDLVLESLEDAQVREGSPSQNYGALTTMRVRDDATSDYHAYVKFEVPSTGNVVSSALLRLFVTDASPDGGDVRLVPPKWNEATINWSNAPPLVDAPVGNLGNVALGTWAELDVTDALTQDSGFLSFGIANADANSVFYSSREGADAPQLVLELDPPVLPEADFHAERVGGTAPLTVQFFDLSSGVPTSWSWSFGDGGTSTAQNPSHVYATPGQFTVTLEVSNENGSDMVVRSNYVRVTLHVAAHDKSTVGGRDVSLPLRNRGDVVRWVRAPLEDAAESLVDRLESSGFDVRRMPLGGASYRATRRGETWSFSLQSLEGGTVLRRAAR